MKFSTLLLVPMALALSASGQIVVQADAKDDTNKDPKTVSVTGCLAQSDNPGGAKQYIIKSENLSYPLEARTENLSAHVGHKVTISGISMKGKALARWKSENRTRVGRPTA